MSNLTPVRWLGWAVWLSAGALVLDPLASLMKARALTGLRRFDEARILLDKGIELINKAEHRMHEAEIYRELGELQRQMLDPDVAAAEASFCKALEVARAQEAKGWELRAAMSLARLWQTQGKCGEGYELLAPIYNWFTEGFDTKDLKDAKALLKELSAR
jgi:predicted ATPase